MNEAELVRHLIRELEASGYPEESIRLEFSVGGASQRRWIDLAIIDPVTNDVVAIIEAKRGESSKVLDDAAKQVASYAKLLPSNPLSLVYVFFNESKHIGLVSGSDSTVNLIESFPTYESLLSGGRAQNKVNVKNKSAKVIDTFMIVCFLLALIVTVILALDIKGAFKFSTQQLSLLGIVIGLIIIPFAAKFKFMGMEFERYVFKSKNT